MPVEYKNMFERSWIKTFMMKISVEAPASVGTQSVDTNDAGSGRIEI